MKSIRCLRMMKPTDLALREKEEMDLNRMIPKTGAAIVSVTVFLFAVFQIVDFPMGSFFVCLILPIGFIMMTAGLRSECESCRKVPADIGMAFAAVYCMLIMLVYFTQLTTVKNEQLTEQAAKLIDFSRFGLMFHYDLLGYGIMALSTFFTGLSMNAKNRTGKWLKALMMIHGVFFLSCTFMPMTGMLSRLSSDSGRIGGRLALAAWCAYFLPVGILSFLHFRKS